MKKLKKLLYLGLLGLVLLVIGYFVNSYNQFTNNVDIEVFRHGFYRTKNNNGFISFGSFKNTVICVNDVYYFIGELTYDKGIFTLNNRDNEEIYKIGVVDEDTIYSKDINTFFSASTKNSLAQSLTTFNKTIVYLQLGD